MNLSMRLLSRHLTGVPVPLPAGVQFSVVSYSRAAIGGPMQATINVSGPPDALPVVLNLLRCAVEITDDHACIVWHGYVDQATLNVGALSIGVGLDALGNSVKITYADHGESATTTAATDADSIAEYGTRELLVSLGDGNLAQALQLRDIVLAQRHYPLPVPGVGGSGGASSAVLQCRGWWSTLGWQSFATAAVKVENTALGGPKDYAQLNVGNGGLAQSFLITDPTAVWAIESVDLLLGWFTTLYVTLHADNGDPTYPGPGTLLATSDTLATGGVDLEAGDLTRSRFVFSTPVDIDGATTYWLKLNSASTPGWNSSIYGPYADGQMRWYDGAFSLWKAFGGAGRDAPFSVNGIQQTTQQISQMLAQSAQFITGCDVLTPSGVWANPYRAGDQSTLAEVENLLKAGGTTDVRILANVTPARRVQLYAEPASTTIANYVDSKLQLYDVGRNPIDASLCPAGVWCGLLDVIPLTAGLSRLAPLTPFFIEQSSVDVRSGKWTPTPRGINNAFRVTLT